MTQRAVLVAAGGTGGHLFPAYALSAELARRGIPVELVTEERALRFGEDFPARAVHHVTSATPTGGGVHSRVRALTRLALGLRQARKVVKQTRPRAVVGFGGYPTVPPVLAASQLKIPTILHEQNAVMGRANRFLARRVRALAKGFDNLPLSPELAAKARLTGNPIRPSVLEAAATPYPARTDDKLQVLVTGGSQGARVMSDVVPAAVALLPPAAQRRLVLVQQARGEDEARVREAYAKLGVTADVRAFFKDLPAQIAKAHLVVARSGASTVSELAVIGRPSILVPFPHALDQDQAANATLLAASGAATVVRQAEFSPAWLAEALSRALDDDAGLRRRAAAAKAAGITDAAERLADLVESIMLPDTK